MMTMFTMMMNSGHSVSIHSVSIILDIVSLLKAGGDFRLFEKHFVHICLKWGENVWETLCLFISGPQQRRLGISKLYRPGFLLMASGILSSINLFIKNRYFSEEVLLFIYENRCFPENFCYLFVQVMRHGDSPFFWQDFFWCVLWMFTTMVDSKCDWRGGGSMERKDGLL